MTSRAILLDRTNQTQNTQTDHLKRRAEGDCDDETSGKRVKTTKGPREDGRTACDNDVELPGGEQGQVHRKTPQKDLYSSLRALRMGNPVACRTFTCGFSVSLSA